MAYEVTKQIKGRDYRYRVESIRNPDTGRSGTRWTYLGKVEDGEVVAPARIAAKRVTHDEIIEVTAQLLETRDTSRVTVSVIAHNAGVSPGTFYRHFADREAALAAAIAFLSDRCFRALPVLDAPIGDFAHERARLNRWFEGLNAAVLNGRAFRWFLTTADHDKLLLSVQKAAVRSDPSAILERYFRALDAAGLALVAAPRALADGIFTLHRSIVRDIALHDEADARLRWAVIFPVIERAVFRETNFIGAA